MTSLADDKRMALRVGYAASDWARGVPFHDFEAYFSTWEVLAVMQDTSCLGAAFFNPATDELHFSILPEWRKRWLTPGLLRRIKSIPRIITAIPPGYEHVANLLERVGFKQQPDGKYLRVA